MSNLDNLCIFSADFDIICIEMYGCREGCRVLASEIHSKFNIAVPLKHLIANIRLMLCFWLFARYVHTYIHTHTYIYTYIHARIQARTQTHACTYACTRIYIKHAERERERERDVPRLHNLILFNIICINFTLVPLYHRKRFDLTMNSRTWQNIVSLSSSVAVTLP